MSWHYLFVYDIILYTAITLIHPFPTMLCCLLISLRWPQMQQCHLKIWIRRKVVDEGVFLIGVWWYTLVVISVDEGVCHGVDFCCEMRIDD